MRKIVLVFGLIAGVVMSGMLVVTLPFQDQLGGGAGMAVGYASMVLASLMIYFGIRQYRDVESDGTLAFWPAARVGLLISAVAVLCYVLTWEVVYNVYLPDFGEQYMAGVLERARAAGATAEELATLTETQGKFWQTYKDNPLVRIGFTALEPLPVLLLFTFGSAGLLRTKRNA